MAMIQLLTGQPGHGKSLLAITKGLAFVAEGRQVYAAGFKGLNYEATGFKPLPFDFTAYDPVDKDDRGRQMPKWQTLPDGAVIILDECYDYIPQRSSGKPVPPHVDALARHRHNGFDIILVTQKHDQIDGFVKGLIGEHIHVRNKFGLKRAVLRKWDAFQENVKRKADSVEQWKYPEKNYALYTSATQHSVKRKLPWFIYAVPLLLALIIGCVYYVAHSFGHVGAGATGAAATGGPATARPASSGLKDADESLRQRDYAKWMQPRVAGQPWTAPAWDKLQPQGVPDLYCIAVDDGRCRCMTEQGTHYEVKPGICRVIARDGVYNPFRQPINGRHGEGRRDDRERKPAPPSPPVTDPVASALPVAAAVLHAGIHQSYVPPEYQPGTVEGSQ